MPLTIAHPIAVIPLGRRLPLSALVIGSMTHDLEFPLRLAAVSRFSHTLPAVLYFCLPAGLLLLFAWRWLLREPSMQLVPPGARHALFSGPRGGSGFPAGAVPACVAALLAGALTHILWDSFTHDYGWIVERWPLLQACLLRAAGHEIRAYKLLQWGSSAAGVLALAVVARRRVLRGPAADGEIRAWGGERPLAVAIAALTLAYSTCMAAVSAAIAVPAATAPRVFATQFAICGMISFAMCMILYGTILKVVRAGREISGG